MPDSVSESERQAIDEALREGRKIEAIKLYRLSTGAGLAEAKAAIEAMQAKRVGEPPRERSIESTKSGCGSAVLVLVMVGGAALLLFQQVH